MLALTLTPAEVWNHPVSDAAYSGFDPNLVYASSGGSGSVKVSADSIDMTAPPSSAPSVNLATTPLQKFDASVAVVVQENEGAITPFRLGLWSPWSGAGYFVEFGPAPQNPITAEAIANGNPGVTLLGGEVLSRTVVGNYRLGSTYRVSFSLDKTRGSLAARVSDEGGSSVSASVDSRQSPKLFGDVALSLNASVAAGGGSSRVVLSGYSVNLPHERLWASKIADPRAEIALIGLAVAGVLLLAVTIVPRLATGLRAVSDRSRFAGLRRGLAARPRVIAAVAIAIAAYLAGNAWLFPLGGHPFDMAVEKLYAYVARAYGPDQLYYLPNIVSLPKIWHGVPFQETTFPYEPIAAYLFTGIGWLNSLLFAGGATFSLDRLSLEYLIKAVNVLFGLGDAGLIYWILRQIGVGNRWSLAGGGLFLFNPAVWFSMSVWGQTHVISLFFVLAAVLMAEKRLPLWAWLALTVGCLTRPQMLVFGLLLGIVLLRKFPWKDNVAALSWTVILTFLVLAPFTLATSPSLPVDILLNTFRAHEGGASGLVLTTVSQDTYSVWPLVEYLTQGVSGLHQAFNPSNGVLVGHVTYQSLSQILTFAAILFVAGLITFRRRATDEAGAYLPFVALGITAFLMLLFGLVATHFLLALPFLLLSRRWMGGVAYFYVAVIWTVTTFVTMFGDMGLVMTSQDYPLLAATNNAITRFVVWLYTGDRFIVVGIVANICAVVWLGFLTLRLKAQGQPAALGGPARAD